MKKPTLDFERRTALITGVATGIGRATALAVAMTGAMRPQAFASTR